METIDKNKSGNPMEGEARGNMSIEEFLKKDEQKDLLRFLTAHRGIPKERRTEGLAPFPYSRFC